MIAFAIKAMLLGKSMAGRAWDWIGAKPWHIWAVAVILLAGHDYIGWHGKATLARALHSTKAAYAMAQADAMRAQQAADAALSARYDSIARDNSHEHQIALTEADSAVSRYADVHRVRACPDSSIGGSSAAGMSGNPALPVDASGSPDLVSITVPDLGKFKTATVQADGGQRYLQSLIDEGLAVAGD